MAQGLEDMASVSPQGAGCVLQPHPRLVASQNVPEAMYQALSMGMQVRRMLKGEMACPTDRKKRESWATEEVTLLTTVGANLAAKKTKWYTAVTHT